MDRLDGVRALHRFGLGPRPGDGARIAADPRGAFLAELGRPEGALLGADGLDSGAAQFAAVRRDQRDRDRRRAEARMPSVATPGVSPAAPPPAGQASITPGMAFPAAGAPPPAASTPNAEAVLYRGEVEARLARVQGAETGLLERLVLFWGNHFAVQVAKGGVVRGLAGAFEREAVRPNVLGSFADLLLAATRHPAMLASLDNAGSFGPNSQAGQRQRRGLNENHARELLELHTIGVDGGYGQDDVTSLARILTGWTYGGDQAPPAEVGRFVFRAGMHEPGAQRVVGRTYQAAAGAAQGEAVIRDLARAPQTAAHVALKLARHFVSDAPPPALVERLARTFRNTDGNLAEVARALLDADEAWSPERSKVKTPQLFLFAALRALRLSVDAPFANRVLRVLGQELWDPPSPQGFADTAVVWLAPDAFRHRLDMAELLAARSRVPEDPRVLADEVLGPAMSGDTRQAVARAESRVQGLALLLMSPDFQRS